MDNTSNETVIKVTNLYKSFQIAGEGTGTLKGLVIHPLDTLRSKRAAQAAKKQNVLRGINFELKAGEFFGVVGRNGSGKSTLLKILAGIYQPTKGEVQLQGRVVPFIEFGVGFNGELTGRENVYLNGAILGFSRAEVDKKFRDIIEFSELEYAMDRKLKNYSSGMQVRLAFSIATRLAESDILLIDEVLAVGDADFQRKCFDYFRGLKKQNKTVILITHDMNAVRQYCDRAILIDKGKVAIAGSQEDVAAAYTRMFQEEDMEVHDILASERWGSRKLEYSEVTISKRVLNTPDKSLTISCKVTVNEEVEDPIFGISIMNSAGERIFGSNNTLQRIKAGTLIPSNDVEVEWVVPNIMNEGHYSVCITAALQDGEICDNWDEAKQFRVYQEFSTGFPVNPPLDLTLDIK